MRHTEEEKNNDDAGIHGQVNREFIFLQHIIVNL